MLHTIKYIAIVYLTIGCQKTSREEVLYIKVCLTTLCITKSNVHVTSKLNTLPLVNRGTPITKLISFVSFFYISSRSFNRMQLTSQMIIIRLGPWCYVIYVTFF